MTVRTKVQAMDMMMMGMCMMSMCLFGVLISESSL